MMEEEDSGRDRGLERLQLLPRKFVSHYYDENHVFYEYPFLPSLAASILAITTGGITGCLHSVYGAAIFGLVATFVLTFPLCIIRIDLTRRRQKNAAATHTWELLRFVLYWILAVLLAVEISNCRFAYRELDNLCDYSQMDYLNNSQALNNASTCDLFIYSNAIVPNVNYLRSFMDTIPGVGVNCFCIAPLMTLIGNDTNNNSSQFYPLWAVNLESIKVPNCTCNDTRAAWTQTNQTHQMEIVYDPYKSRMTENAVAAFIKELGLPSNSSSVSGFWGDDFVGDAQEMERVSCRAKRGLLWFLFLFTFLVAAIEFGVPRWLKYRSQRGSLIKEHSDAEYSDL